MDSSSPSSSISGLTEIWEPSGWGPGLSPPDDAPMSLKETLDLAASASLSNGEAVGGRDLTDTWETAGGGWSSLPSLSGAGPSSPSSSRMRDAVDLLEKVVDEEREASCCSSSSTTLVFSISIASSSCGEGEWRFGVCAIGSGAGLFGAGAGPL